MRIDLAQRCVMRLSGRYISWTWLTTLNPICTDVGRAYWVDGFIDSSEYSREGRPAGLLPQPSPPVTAAAPTTGATQRRRRPPQTSREADAIATTAAQSTILLDAWIFWRHEGLTPTVCTYKLQWLATAAVCVRSTTVC